MTDHVELRRGGYADSVRLLQVSRDAQRVDGVVTAQVAMATPLNLEVLAGMGFDVSDASPDDLVVAIRVADDAADEVLSAARAAVEAALAERGGSAGPGTGTAYQPEPPRTTAAALRRTPTADAGTVLALVSVPGASAAVEAMDALEAGCDVMVFSDHVPLEQELALKRAAEERGLLVMGPDCGTALVGGVGLGFANAVAPGPVGIVAASGTGCQQLLCLLDHAGVGVTSALGVGGRDLSAAIGGLATLAALRRLDADPAVELVVLVSKPPAPEVAAAVEEYAATLGTPVELALLGPGRPDLTAVAERVIRRLGRQVPDWPVVPPVSPPESPPESAPESPVMPPVVPPGRALPAPHSGGLLRGLFSGGTLCDEAMLIAAETLGPVRSNIPLSPGLGLGPDLTAPAHLMVDFGEDALTAGRAHPMIDPTLRLEHLARTAADERTGVVLMDVVLGHGADPDPAATLAPALREVPQPVVVSLVGTDLDPQGRTRQARALAEAGAEVHLSNAGAARRAVQLLGGQR